MKKLFIYIYLLFMCACNTVSKDEYTIAFYNVENLFDTTDDKSINDDDFLPKGEKKWDAEKYKLKLSRITEVLRAIKGEHMPEIIGLCEVENRKVLDDLIYKTEFEGKYAIAHQDSPDRRGIDCALVYNKKSFRLVNTDIIRINLPWNDKFRTRDILHVEGKLLNGEHLHIYVNHWPSRREGKLITERRRMYVASILKENIVKLRLTQEDARIIILGDFNDEPTNKAVVDVLQAKPLSVKSDMNLFNLMYRYDIANSGSYKYRGEWNMLDNIIVSGNLLDKSSSYYCEVDGGKIFRENWFTFQKRNGEKLPNRTYLGSRYVAGYSDHFPVYLKLKLKR